MLRLLISLFFFLLCVSLYAQQHPATFFTKAEAADVKKNLNAFPVLTQSYNEIKKDVDEFVGKDVDVPFPKEIGRAHV